MMYITHIFAFTIVLSVYNSVIRMELLIDVNNKDFLYEDNDDRTYLENLRYEIREREDELDKVEKIKDNFEKVMKLVNILGQLDSFVSKRTKNVIRKLAVLAQDQSAEN